MAPSITNKISKLLAILSYPVRIIPTRNHKDRLTIDDIDSKEKIGMVRRSLRSKANTFDKFDSVREDALIRELKDVPGLSLNLLGGPFKTKHIRYVPSKEAGKEWKKQETRLWFKYIKFVTYKFKSVPIYFFIEDLHNITYPYSRPNDSKFKDFIKKYGAPVSADGKVVTVYGASIVRHIPTKLNYWHVQFELLDIEARMTDTPTSIIREKIKSYSSQEHQNDISKQHWINRAASYALNTILLQSAKAKIETRKCTKIPKVIYLIQKMSSKEGRPNRFVRKK